jgi:hypothetical protein
VSAPGPAAYVGSYQLLAKIGEGGMGVVHLGEDRSGTRVAVKMLRAHVVGDDQGRARMAREVTSLRRVRSPRVAEVYDADPWGDHAYVVTRYVDGPSLHDYVQANGPLAGEALLALALGLAEALVAVHAADVLHRDVKPSNVLVENRQPVLIDFGLAQLSDDSKLTHSGWLLGTPGYLAPEILYGDDPTPKADVHSWASTVVFAATGVGPYGKGPAVAVMDRVRRGEHDLSAVPPWLSWIVARALLPDPRDRPTARELVEWLSGIAAGQPMPAMAAAPARPELLPSQSPQPRLHVDAPASARRVDVAQPPIPWAPGESPSPQAAVVAFWCGVLALLTTTAVWSPIVAAAGLLLVGCLLRTLVRRSQVIREWQRRRGPRANDGVLATLCLPWFAVLTLPGTLVNAGLALVDGAIIVALWSLLVEPASPSWVLAAAALAAGLLVWWGPMSHDVRAGGRQVTGFLLQPGAATWLVIALVWASAGLCLIAFLDGGAVYGPLPEPPWHDALRGLDG